jgi:Virulence factor membrane-bound polymerase, C-terminal
VCFLLPVGLMMGLLDGLPPIQRVMRVHAAWVAGAALAAGSLLVLISVDYMKVEDNVRTLRFEVARIGTGTIESQAPDLLLLSQWSEYLHVARIEARPSMPAHEVERMSRASERFPYALLQLELARAQGLNGQPEAAAVTLRRLCSLHSPRQCRRTLADWREQAKNEHPALAAVTLPAVR